MACERTVAQAHDRRDGRRRPRFRRSPSATSRGRSAARPAVGAFRRSALRRGSLPVQLLKRTSVPRRADSVRPVDHRDGQCEAIDARLGGDHADRGEPAPVVDDDQRGCPVGARGDRRPRRGEAAPAATLDRGSGSERRWTEPIEGTVDADERQHAAATRRQTDDWDRRRREPAHEPSEYPPRVNDH